MCQDSGVFGSSHLNLNQDLLLKVAQIIALTFRTKFKIEVRGRISETAEFILPASPAYEPIFIEVFTAFALPSFT